MMWYAWMLNVYVCIYACSLSAVEPRYDTIQFETIYRIIK